MRMFFSLLSSGLVMASVMTLIGGLYNTVTGKSLALSIGGSSTPLPTDLFSSVACAGVLAFVAAAAWTAANLSTVLDFGKRRPGVLAASLLGFAVCVYGAYFTLAGGRLGMACERDDAGAVSLALAKSKVPQDELDDHLYQALKAGRLNSARALLAGGADPNHLTEEKKATVLVDGVVFFPQEAVLLLLEMGADPRREDALGRTAAHTLLLYRFQFRQGETEDSVLALLQALGQHGADLKKADKEGKTPRDLAREGNLKQIQSWLDSL